MKKRYIAAIFILLPLILGFAVSAPVDIGTRYASLDKPPLSPPELVFPIVWSILYIFMGIGLYLAYKSAQEKGVKTSQVLTPYVTQLILNLIWTPVFFGAEMLFAGSLISVLIVVFLIRTVWAFSSVNRTAAYLQIPYIAWSVFASYLSFGIYFLNR